MAENFSVTSVHSVVDWYSLESVHHRGFRAFVRLCRVPVEPVGVIHFVPSFDESLTRRQVANQRARVAHHVDQQFRKGVLKANGSFGKYLPP